jgi:diketogulonate reductase-like aldo/keto reductase
MPIMAYSPIEQGNILHHPELIRIAKAYQATPAQLALAFLLERDGVIVMPKTSNAERAAENRDCVSLEITDDDWDALDAAFPPPTKKKPLEML